MGKKLFPFKLSYKQNLNLLFRMLHYFAPYKLRICLAVFCMMIVAAATGGAAYLVKSAMDDIFINKNIWALSILPLIYVGLDLIKGIARFTQNYMMQYSGLYVLEKIRDELYDRIIRLPVKFYEDNQVGMLMSRIINDVTLIRHSMPSMVMIVRETLTLFGLMVVVFYQNAELAFWAVFVLPVGLLPFAYIGRKLRKLGRRSQGKIADISVFLQEIFSGIRVVKAFGMEKEEAARFAVENERLVKISLKQTVYNELSSPIMEFVGAVGIGFVLWYGGKQVIDGIATPGTFFSFVAALAMMYDPVKKITGANNDVQRALAGAERVFEILDSEEIHEQKGGDIVFNGKFTTLEFKNVSFSYAKGGQKILNDVSLSVHAGERIAIVGPSGSGKSTFVNLIPRFYDVQEGEILLNGVNIKEYTLGSLRRGIALVSQDTFLFNMSVRANIGYGAPDIDDAKILEAAQKAFAHEFILDLPEGYETILGERGVKISGGQKQRLAIARAIHKNVPLLILDEATSALDSESERIVQLALENLMHDKTSIVIAHRLSTVLNSDRILVMNKGRIIEEGTHESLLKTSRLYAKLYRVQFMSDGEG